MHRKELFMGITTILLVVGIMILSLVWFMISIVGESPLSIKGDVLSVGGYYHKEIELKGAKAYWKEEPIDLDLNKTGVFPNKIKKGKFLLKGREDPVYLNIMDFDAPYILIESGNDLYFINCGLREETVQLFQKIERVLNG